MINEKKVIFINADLELEKYAYQCKLITIDNIAIKNISKKSFEKLYFVIDTKESSKDFYFYHKSINKYTLLINGELKEKIMKNQLIQLRIDEPQVDKVYKLSIYIKEKENSEKLSPPFKITITIKKIDEEKQRIEEEKRRQKESEKYDDGIDYKGLSKKDVNKIFNNLEDEFLITSFRSEEEIKKKIIDLQCNENELVNWIEGIM